MKILFHLNSLGRGGAERVVSILGNAFVQEGHEVVIATEWESEKEYPVDEKVRRIHVGLNAAEEEKGRAAKILIRYARLRDWVKKEKPDIVVSFCNKANFRCAVAMLGMRTPLLVSVRNDPRIDYASYRISTKIMEHKAAGCVFQTPDAQAFFSKKFQKKSKILYNPIAQQYIGLPKREPGRREKVIATAGRITAQKNQMLLLRAFAGISGEFPGYVLKLYGAVEDSRLYEEMKLFAANQGLTGRVLFMGAVDSLQEEIADVALFVLSSDYEGMPNALIEAMVMGIPSIATDCPCGGAGMLIENRVTGLLVPTGDCEALTEAMRYMLAHPAEAERMGDKARALADKVNPQAVCGEWLKYIQELVG